MKVLNTIHEDYHVHSLNFSDGMNTVDEIVQYAGKIGLKKIVITDHSQILLDSTGMGKKCARSSIRRWKNVHNDVEVVFGVEGDLLNEEGDCCFDIQGQTADFLILSCHENTYEGAPEKLTQAYVNAINNHHDKISCIGHFCKKGINDTVDLKVVVKLANKYHIPIEFNGNVFRTGSTDLDKMETMLNLVDQIYVNSDAHTLADLSNKQKVFDYLKEKGHF